MNIKIDALNYYGATKKYHLHFPALREDIEADVVIIGGGSLALTPPLSWRNRDHQRGGAGGAPSRLRRHRAQRRR